MGIERAELRLVWPAELFAVEARALLARSASSIHDVGFLLDEAFHGSRAFKLFTEVDAAGGWSADPWTSLEPVEPTHPGQVLLAELARDAHSIPMWAPRAYYSARAVGPQQTQRLTVEQVRVGWGDIVLDLSNHGYLDDEFGSHCPDTDDNPVEQGARRIAELLGTNESEYLWPLLDEDGDRTGVEKTWSLDRFADMVELFHDLMARPRSRYDHDFHNGYDYSDFARPPGRAVYRWRVNELLARTDLGLGLVADTTGDGWLVRVPTDARSALPDKTLAAVAPEARSGIEHALRLYRSRNATREDKRSAIVELGGYLEKYRQRVKQHLVKKDEDALFEILNHFDLRHRKADQRADYDEMYLDWLFWWYLATVELVGRLATRDDH